jgi:hypothetical protein
MARDVSALPSHSLVQMEKFLHVTFARYLSGYRIRHPCSGNCPLCPLHFIGIPHLPDAPSFSALQGSYEEASLDQKAPADP